MSKLEDSDLFIFINESAIDSWNTGRSVVGGSFGILLPVLSSVGWIFSRVL